MSLYHIHVDSTIILNLRMHRGPASKGRTGLGGNTQLGSRSKQKQAHEGLSFKNILQGKKKALEPSKQAGNTPNPYIVEQLN